MKKSTATLIIFFLLLISGSVFSQQFIPKKCYWHFTGKIAEKYMVTLNLVKINDSLYGDYQLRDLTGKEMMVPREIFNISSPPVICGRMKTDGTFSLNTPFMQGNPVAVGHFSGGQNIKGTWENKEGKFPFEMHEQYSDGTVQFNVSWLKAQIPLVSKKGSPSGKIQLALLTPAESSDPLISDSLRKIILGKYCRSNDFHLNPDSNLNRMKQSYADNYVSSNQELYKSNIGGQSMNWESLEFMHILYNDRNFLTFYTISYAFTGGAHGMEVFDFNVVDLKTGKIISLAEIFAADQETALTALLTREFQKLNNVKPGQKLTEAGFFVDEVKPSRNFYITDEGIGFFYNHYEIAPYSNGPSNCFLTYEELRPLMRKDSVLKELTGKE